MFILKLLKLISAFRICQKEKIPLVNSGTEGFLGTVANHINAFSACYNCKPKTKKKTIPVCSIRSRPEKMEHCVAWAKLLFCLLFTSNTSDNLLEDYKIHSNKSESYQNYFFYNILTDKENDLQDSSKKSTSRIKPVDVQNILEFEYADINSYDSNLEYFNFCKNIFVSG